MKKRIIVMICIVTMMVSVIGCAGSDRGSEVVNETAEVTETADTSTEEQAVDDVSEPAEETAADIAEESTEEPEEAEEPEEEAPEFSIGEVKDEVYENEYLGIKFTPLEGMEFASEERLAELSSSTKETLKDIEKTREALENGSVLIVCYASTDSAEIPVKSFNITMQMTDTAQFDDTNETLETEILASAGESIKTVLEQNGDTDVEVSVEPGSFLGEKHMIMNLTAKIEGVGMLFEQEAVVIQDGCVAAYTASIVYDSGEPVMDILDHVEKLK